jgi:hypothetical protein
VALEIILICLTAVSTLNALLIYDLYGRSSKMVLFLEAARKAVVELRKLVELRG